MGEYFRSGTQIRDFWPDDTEDKVYIDTTWTTTNLSEIIDVIKAHWGIEHIDLNEFEIGSEHIQTKCLGHTRYDCGDYNDFLVITRVK